MTSGGRTSLLILAARSSPSIAASACRDNDIEPAVVEAASPSSAEAATWSACPTAPSLRRQERRFVALSSTMRAPFPSSRCVSKGAPGMSASPAHDRPWNVLPSPATPALSTHIVPPISSASRLLIASPSPVPP